MESEIPVSKADPSPERLVLVPKRNTRPTPPATVQRIREEAATGKSVREIATLVGVGKSTVSLLLRSHAPVASAHSVARELTSCQAAGPLSRGELMDTAKTSVPSVEMDSSAATDFLSQIQASSQGRAVPSMPAPVAKGKAAPVASRFSDGPATLAREADLSSFLAEFDTPANEVPRTTVRKTPKARATKASKADAFLTDIYGPLQTIQVKDDSAEKSVLITKITVNVENFETVLASHIKPTKEAYLKRVSGMNLQELKTTLGVLETVRSSNNLANQMKHMLFGGASLIEYGSAKVGLKTQGYAQLVRAQEEEIQSILREIALNNVESFKSVQRPELRLATILATSLLACDSRNRILEIQKARSEPKVSYAEPATVVNNQQGQPRQPEEGGQMFATESKDTKYSDL